MRKNNLLLVTLCSLPMLLNCNKSPTNLTLEDYSWEEIKNISDSGLASEKFKIGDTKTVILNNLKHTVRIIGFNHDPIANEEKKAGITFEFANVITTLDSDDKPAALIVSQAEDYFQDFIDTSINATIQGEIYDMLPNDLKSVIKTITKDISIGESYTHSTYDTKLFPLSYTEVGKENTDVFRIEGSAYEYYQTFDNAKLVKKIASNVENGSLYWLRSPSMLHERYYAFGAVDGSGYPFADYENYDNALAPAFCI